MEKANAKVAAANKTAATMLRIAERKAAAVKKQAARREKKANVQLAEANKTAALIMKKAATTKRSRARPTECPKCKKCPKAGSSVPRLSAEPPAKETCSPILYDGNFVKDRTKHGRALLQGEAAP